jgi:hypothetical protein
MPVVGLRNADAQLIGSVDHLDVEDRNFGAAWYDSVGGGSFAAAITVPMATERHNSAPEIYNMSSGILTVAEAGLYFFSFAVGVSHAGSTEMIFNIILEQDPDTGIFTEVPGTTTYTTFLTGFGTGFNTALLRVGIDYRYRLRVSSLVGGSNSLIANGSHLSVFRLFKNG